MNTILRPQEFPQLLKEIPDKPEKLYIKGSLPSNELKFLCVVGSRKCTQYGKEATESLIEGLRGYPIAVVSGLALGIDAIAHETALKNNLPTLAFPGSGLNENVLYPRSNLELAKKIVKAGGALISEFEPNFGATPWSFPQRNRLMAGISHATLIIEAELKSGTLITSKFATEYNRDVLTIPGSIFSKTTEGPHMLLRLGATPITKSEDILEALHITPKKAEQKFELALKNVSPEELTVLNFLPLTREELLEKLPMPVGKANVLLSTMEIKGMIKERMGEIFRNM